MQAALFRLMKQQRLLPIIFLVALALFAFHAYTIVGRFVKFEILEVHKVIQNKSLPMPIAVMQLISLRNPNSTRPHAQMHFNASLNLEPLPRWAYVNESTQLDETRWQEYIAPNLIDADNYFEYSNNQSYWPLRAYYANGERDSGYTITGFINASNFVKKQENGDEDMINFKISSFETDFNGGIFTDTKGLPAYFELFPCDELSIGINLQRRILINRAESPCRNEYPPQLKKLIKNPLEPKDLYNSVLAPDLPYDQQTCQNLCVANYWQPRCNCTMFQEVLRYAGNPPNTTLCNLKNYNDTNDDCAAKNASSKTPAEEYARCSCYKRCAGFEFVISGYDKIHHNPGSAFCSEEESKITVKVFYADLSYEVIEDTQSYPFLEMFNELVGICGLYCKTLISRN